MVPVSKIVFGTDFPFRNAAEHVKGLKDWGVCGAGISKPSIGKTPVIAAEVGPDGTPIIVAMTSEPASPVPDGSVRRFASAAEADRHDLVLAANPDTERVLDAWQLSQELWRLRGDTLHEPGLHRSLKAFAAADVRFLIVGAYALALHGRPRATVIWTYGSMPRPRTRGASCEASPALERH